MTFTIMFIALVLFAVGSAVVGRRHGVAITRHPHHDPYSDAPGARREI